jgi:hypothetical protein
MPMPFCNKRLHCNNSAPKCRFGGVEDSLQRVEWLNVQVLDASPGEVIVAISPSHTQGLTVGVVSAMASAREDLDLLSSSPFWSLAAVSD